MVTILDKKLCEEKYNNKEYEFPNQHGYRCLSIQGGNQLTQVDSTMDFNDISQSEYFVQYLI